MSKLESIVLKKFKGACNEVQIDFDKNVNLTVIFGENGTGKSAIADAFDFVCNNSIGSLDDKSVGFPKGKYVPTINSDISECKVCLKYDNKEWISTLAARYIPSTTGPTIKPTAKVLRREKIQDFIIKQPKERYEAIKSFIETPNSDKLESLVNQLRKNKEKEYEEASRAVAQAHESLEKLWTAENKPGENYLEWAEDESKEDKKSLETTKKSYQDILTPLLSIETSYTNLNNAEKDLKAINDDFKTKEVNFKKLSSEASEAIVDLISILKATKKYIEKEKTISQCPVCEQSVISKDLITKIDYRLKNLDDIVLAQEELETSGKKVEFHETQTKKAKIKFIELCINTAMVFKEANVPEITSLNINWETNKELLDKKNKDKLELMDISTEFYEKALSIKDEISYIIDGITKKLNSLNAISTQLGIINEKTETASNLELLNNKVKELHNLIIKSRNDFVEDVLNSISADIDAIYSKIHPDENIGEIKLLTDPSKKASLDLKAKFQAQVDILPQAYYSESHLDTLGICLFIALSKLYKNDDTILILDDVITSADQVHLSRFIRVLEDELKNFAHTIITTHYQVWRDKYRYGKGNMQLIELLNWSIDRGIRHTKTKIYIDELKGYLKIEPLDKQIVASKAGIFLELILDNLALMYECMLPRKSEPFYTLGEFLNAFAKLKNKLKIEIHEDGNLKEEILLLTLFDVLPEDSILRNEVGCHFNVIGQNYSEGDIKNMADNTLKLAEALICDSCGELPYKSKSGSYYECKCGSKHLYPLEN